MTGGFDNFYVMPIGWDWYICIYKFDTNINWMVLSEQEYDQFAPNFFKEQMSNWLVIEH